MRYIKVLGLVALFFFSMLFFVQNNEVLMQELALSLKVFGWDYQSEAVPFYLLILLSFVIGALLCTLYFFLERARLSKLCKQLRKKNTALEQEVASLQQPKYDTFQETDEACATDQN
ncbi:MAG: LapA family protein [Desulfomicrobium sp.]|jgi:putative membrane protein|nr:LapA family protein [Desulfomicrobium sp.]NLV96154.1 LapA family protein [Desulfovibrionales bacterium]